MDKLEAKLPDSPGVYFFLGSPKRGGGGKKRKEILYIGKATSLRDRVRSYFSSDLSETRGQKLVEMLAAATSVSFEETESALEALVLESNLIKKYQPYYNTREKDDRSFNYVVVTKEDFPRVLVVRGKDLATNWDPDEVKYQFGPYTAGGELKAALKIVRKIIPFRDKCQVGAGKPCFNAQIGLCPGVCDSRISKTVYGKLIRNLKLFFEGKKSQLTKSLESQMKKLVKAEKFEQAAVIRDQLFALSHINDVAMLKRAETRVSSGFRIEAYDIAHISGTSTTGAMVVMEGGELAKHEYKRFKLKGTTAKKNNDVANLEEILRRRFKHTEWARPDLIVIDGGRAQLNRAERVLASLGESIPLVSVVKDEKHKPRDIMGDSSVVKDYRGEILQVNAEAHRFSLAYHKKLRDRI